MKCLLCRGVLSLLTPPCAPRASDAVAPWLSVATFCCHTLPRVWRATATNFFHVFMVSYQGVADCVVYLRICVFGSRDSRLWSLTRSW